MYRRDFESNKNVMPRRYLLICFVWGCYLPEGQDEVESIKLCIVIRPLLLVQSLDSTAQVGIVPSIIARSASYPRSQFILVTFFLSKFFFHRFCLGGAGSFLLSVYVA